MAPATCPPGFRLPALVRFDDDALVEDPRRADHQQAQVADDVVDQFGIADVVALDVEPEVVPAQATTVGELDLEIEHRPILRITHRRPRSTERRVGKECDRTCGYRWSQEYKKK